jgi:hypothetical protein
MPIPRTSLAVLALLLTSAGSHAFPARAGLSPDGYPPETAYSVALHMHGSMSEQFASWEWHDWKAESAGVDVVWWTDHDWRLTNWRHTNRYDFESAFWQADSSRWAEPDDQYANEFRYWEADPADPYLLSAICDTLSSQGTQSLRLWTHATQVGPDFDAGRLEQTASAVQNKHSLAKRIRVAFSVFPETLDAADARFVLEAELSDHPEGTHILRYVVGSMEGEGIHSIALPYTVGTWNSYDVDVTADAIAHFTSGGQDSLRAEDDNLALVKIGLESRNATDAAVFFDDYRILPDPSRVGDVLLDRSRAMGDYYETLYPGVRNYHGSEISKFKAQPHLNAYAPNHVLVDYTGHVFADTLHYAIEQIHAQGGVVSLNHAFGPKFDFESNPNETPAQQAGRLDWTKGNLIAARALGVDVLEVGYRRRGGMDLVHHLDLWDALTGNAIWLTANGVTDSHGRGHWNLYGWGPSEAGLSTIDNFVTWLFAEELTEAGLVQAMKRGRACFGDPYRWDGELDLRTLDGFRMGQVVATDRDEHDVVVEVTNVPIDVQVRFRQGEIREDPPAAYRNVNWLRDELLPAAVIGGVFRDTVTVDTALPSFVRVEVTNAEGGELVYGNPLHFVRNVPARGIPAERIGVRAGDVRVFLAENFTLTGTTYDGDVLTLTGDETPVGTGVLRLDPGPLGLPTQVVGADAWSGMDGVVTMSGFAGAGSTLQVVWSGTAVVDPAADTGGLRLAAPRPNPSGDGSVIDYALPREGWVRLEIIDVSGRRVRVLAVGFERAGTHRVHWDGRDEGGMRAASGVYSVRLEHDGETRTRRLARLR